MTEQEAIEKWCPFTRYIGHADGFIHAVDVKVNNTRCIASDCMAWRAYMTGYAEVTSEGIVEHTESHGYCGLAGKP